MASFSIKKIFVPLSQPLKALLPFVPVKVTPVPTNTLPLSKPLQLLKTWLFRVLSSGMSILVKASQLLKQLFPKVTPVPLKVTFASDVQPLKQEESIFVSALSKVAV